MKVIIYGASDDCIELEGDISDEIDCDSKKPKLYVYYKDILQFVIKVTFNGVWHITPMIDEKSFNCEVQLRCKDWNISHIFGSKEWCRYSETLIIDSGDDMFEIVKRRKNI